MSIFLISRFTSSSSAISLRKCIRHLSSSPSPFLFDQRIENKEKSSNIFYSTLRSTAMYSIFGVVYLTCHTRFAVFDLPDPNQAHFLYQFFLNPKLDLLGMMLGLGLFYINTKYATSLVSRISITKKGVVKIFTHTLTGHTSLHESLHHKSDFELVPNAGKTMLRVKTSGQVYIVDPPNEKLRALFSSK